MKAWHGLSPCKISLCCGHSNQVRAGTVGFTPWAQRNAHGKFGTNSRGTLAAVWLCGLERVHMCHHGAQARRLKTLGSRTVPCEQVAKAWAAAQAPATRTRAQIDTYGDTSFHNNSPKSINDNHGHAREAFRSCSLDALDLLKQAYFAGSSHFLWRHIITDDSSHSANPRAETTTLRVVRSLCAGAAW